MNIEQLYEKAAGFEPYDFQRRVAEEGLPELLRVPTTLSHTQPKPRFLEAVVIFIGGGGGFGCFVLVLGYEFIR